jgi:transposase InsO family protein
MPAARRGTARSPNRVWHIDLTTVATAAGAWTSWWPFTLPMCWPCWWLAVVLDHYSRRVVGIAVFKTKSSAQQVTAFLTRIVAHCGQTPRHLISDQGRQFGNRHMRRWCKRRGIRQRFGAVGKPGSISVIERFIRTMRHECLCKLPVIPLQRDALLRELRCFQAAVARVADATKTVKEKLVGGNELSD